MEGLIKQLRTAGIHGATNIASTLHAYSRDASIFEVVPQAVVFPRHVDDIKKLVTFASERSGKVWLTVRAGGTDMGGGSIGASIVIDTTKYLNRIHEVGESFAVTDPGVMYEAFEKATLAHGSIMPSYPASRSLVAVGGMVANNAGGEKSLAYGQTKDYVRQVRAVMADGNEYTFGPLNREELNGKLEQQDFEGTLYRKIYWLIEDNYDLIMSAKPNVSKNSSGYLLWEVWDRSVFNLAKLLTGSQGTLGIISRITFDLVAVKPHRGMLVVFLKDLQKISSVTNALLKHRPEELESFDDKTLSFTVRFFRDFVRVLGAKNLFSLAWSFIPDVWAVLTGGVPKMVLLAEFSGDTMDEVEKKLIAANDDMHTLGIKTRVARTEEDAKKYWTIRRESFNVLRNHSTKKKTVPFIDDVIVRPEHMPEFLPKLEAILKPYKQLTLTVAGHVGNGNFHVIPLMDLSRPDAREVIEEVGRKVYDLVLQYDGSITAEHNDGLIRGPYVKQMFGAEVYELFREVKRIFDPKGIFNPGKKVDVDWEWAMAHIRKR
jgi:FAD/FMN-containing dehydrogenase